MQYAVQRQRPLERRIGKRLLRPAEEVDKVCHLAEEATQAALQPRGLQSIWACHRLRVPLAGAEATGGGKVVCGSLVSECYRKEYTKNRPRFIRCQTCYIWSVEIGFTSRQVTHLTGVPYSTLNLWAKNGLVQPSVAPGTGTGSERIYSFSDLVALKVAFELRKSGVTTSSLKKVVEFLRENENMEKPLSEARLVVTGHDVAIVREGELVSVLSKPGQGYLSFVVDLPQMLGELVNVADATKTFARGIASPQAFSEKAKKQPRHFHGINQRKRART